MPPRGEMSALVQRIVKEGRERAEGDKALAQKIAPLLGGFIYGNSSISSWASGRDRPSAETLLAIAKVSEISLDALLFGQSMRDELAELRGRLERLEGSGPQDA